MPAKGSSKYEIVLLSSVNIYWSLIRTWCWKAYAKFYYKFLLLITSEKQAVVPTMFLCLKIIFSSKLLFLPVLFLRVMQFAPWIVFTGLHQTPGLLLFLWCYMLWTEVQLSARTLAVLEHSPGPTKPQLQGWQDPFSSRESNIFLSTGKLLGVQVSPLKQCGSFLDILACVVEYMITWGIGPDPRITSLLEDKPCTLHVLLQTAWC